MLKMFEKISTKNQSREEWLEYRRHGIGGSDAAAVVGMNEYSTPYLLWLEKTGRMPPKESNEAMRQGTDLEEYVAKRFCEATGKKVKKSNYIYKNTEYPFAFANVDRFVVGENAGLECKTTQMLNMRKFAKGEYPDRYYCQCMHYMAVTGADKWYLAVLVFGKDFLIFEIERDEDEIRALMNKEEGFWDYVKADAEPPCMGWEAETDAINAQYPFDNGSEATMPLLEDMAKEYLDLKAMSKHYSERAEFMAQEIKKEMGDISTVFAGDKKITWKTQTRTSIDIDALLADYPQITIDKYKKQTQMRVFKIK